MKPAALTLAVLVALGVAATLAAGVEHRPPEAPVPWSAAGSPSATCLAAIDHSHGGIVVRADLTVTRDRQGWYAVDGELHTDGREPGRVHCTLLPDPQTTGGVRLAEWSWRPLETP